MQIGKVVGTVVSTQKNRKLEGAKLLLVQPLTLEGESRGAAVLAIDSVGAGVGERVLLVIEGKAAGDALRRKTAAVDAAIIGIVDRLDYRDDL
jgi:ethanolamine utilization protein EutN